MNFRIRKKVHIKHGNELSHYPTLQFRGFKKINMTILICHFKPNWISHPKN